jgi:hypothetical protein
MIINLLTEHNLRGYSFEHTARMILRRLRSNNFIFNVCQQDNVHELITKYRLNINSSINKEIELINNNWGRFDLIEFVLNNKKERIVEKIIIYDVKTKIQYKKEYEFCESNYKFMKRWIEEINEVPKVIIIEILKNWKFNFLILDFNKIKIKVYSRYSKSR